MRLIDADELIRAICREECDRAYEDCDYTCSSVAPVVNAPTVRARVMACETCRHYLGGGSCAMSMERECADGGFECWERK